MFDNLIESKPRRERSTAQAIGAVLLHLVLIMVAVKLTAGAAETVKRMLDDPRMTFLTAPPAPPPPAEPDRKLLRSVNPPPRGFQIVVAPTVIPTETPRVNFRESFDPKNFTRRGTDRGWPDGEPRPRTEMNGVPFTDVQVDEPVQPTRCPEPAYPPALRAVGVSGSVALRYVVGTDGRAERGSITVISSTNPAFEAAAIVTISQCAYQPARIKGVAVRQLVEQNVKFAIGG